MSSGDALRAEDEVQPLNKLLSHGQEGSWSFVLSIDESSKYESIFRSKSRQRRPEWVELELESTGCPCRRAGPGGESIKYDGVSYMLGMRERSRFPDLGTKIGIMPSCFLIFLS